MAFVLFLWCVLGTDRGVSLSLALSTLRVARVFGGCCGAVRERRASQIGGSTVRSVFGPPQGVDHFPVFRSQFLRNYVLWYRFI